MRLVVSWAAFDTSTFAQGTPHAGWTHWETSGAHFYAWDTPLLFFSVDIYTCKPFHNSEAVAFTRDFFGAEPIEYHGF